MKRAPAAVATSEAEAQQREGVGPHEQQSKEESEEWAVDGGQENCSLHTVHCISDQGGNISEKL